MTWLIVVHWLHVLSGIIWFGGYVFMGLGVWPMLLRRPAGEARALSDALGRTVGPLMIVSGTLVFWLGIVRGTLLGPIKSFGALFSTPYGLTFLAALLLTLGLTVHGAVSSRTVAEKVWDGDRFRPGAVAYLGRSYALSLICLALVLVCMVLMRFGL